MFPKNLNTRGRCIRLFLSFALFVYAYLRMSYLVGFVSLFTAFEAVRGWCLFYQIFGKTECPVDLKKDIFLDESR
ncbi:MAG: hypothetical protein A3F67_11890 [Verrucomicrobia bacterium RIFCSPHIGHO2_12_FULL_41_10]|nr:MAG: hypothetical protein A3F67_11890 [Verrucomicrobia bacterium RIFCSPHIGHO2_12_FULL_41_10]